jgi:FAD/FMN-containing dehydrogenase
MPPGTDQSELTPEALAALQARLGPKGCLTDAASLQHYGRDWTRFAEPNPAAVLLPGDIATVQDIVVLANRLGFALVPSGGRTGLSGGAMATAGEVVLSLERMNRVCEVNTIDRTIKVEAGAVTQSVQEAAENAGLFYPVNFASAGSSQIGGNIATNAGGIQVIRYGMTRDWIAGLKVVTGTGELLHLNKGLVKNNAGFDLRQLMVGSEGILGVIVEATLRLCAPPTNPRVIVLGLPSMQAIMQVLQHFQRHIDLLAYEFFSDLALDKVVTHRGLRRPFETDAPFYALLEIEHFGEATDALVFEALEACSDQGFVLDAVMSQSAQQSRDLWRLREDISETISRWTPYKNDIATTISLVPECLAAVDQVVTERYPDLEVVWYGHIGDGNLHLNILKPDDLDTLEFQARCKVVSSELFQIIESMDGSISAEHGVGLLKKPFLSHTRSTEEIALMRHIKRVFDPKGVLNPGKIFD